MKKIYGFCFLIFVTLLSSAQVLNLKFYIAPYYIGSGEMLPTMFDCGVVGSTTSQTDSILVELHDTVVTATIVASSQAILNTNGSSSAYFPNSVIGRAYYISIKHRNMVETWSSVPVLMNAVSNYDFSTAISKAYGNNMMLLSGGLFGFYTGDINQDGNVDLLDFPPLEFCIRNGLFGYSNADLNGDCACDLNDFVILDNNINAGIYSQHP